MEILTELNFWLFFAGFEIIVFLAIFILLSAVFKKKFYISALCNFERIKTKVKKELDYKKGYRFNLKSAIICFKKAVKFYRRKVCKEKLLCFEKEIFINCKSLIVECKNLNSVLKREYRGELFYDNVPKRIIECAEKIQRGLTLDKKDLDYKAARLILISGFYYVSENLNLINNERLKLIIKNFYDIFDRQPQILSNNLYRAGNKKMHFGVNGAHLILDEFGNFAYSKNETCVCNFAKFNLIVPLKFKTDKIFYSDKFCSYYDYKQNFIKICLDTDGNIVIILCKNSKYKIFSVKIFGGKIKFFRKKNFLHSALLGENFSNLISGLMSTLIYNNDTSDCGIIGICLYNAFKGQIKSFKYEQLFKNVKLITLFVENDSFSKVLKIIKNIKIFNKFNFEYYIIAISDRPVLCADENFSRSSLQKTQVEFLKKRSALIYENQKIKINLKPQKKISLKNFWQNSPFFAIDNFSLNGLIEILYGFKFTCGDKIVNFCLQKICELNYENYEQNFENLVSLFKKQTLDGRFPSNENFDFYDFKDNLGTAGVLLYLINFINFYNDKSILDEVTFYNDFENFKLKISKTRDTLRSHVFCAVENLINTNENIKVENFKVFVFKSLLPILEPKLKTRVLNYINGFEKDNPKNIFAVLYNAGFAEFKKAVLNLVNLDDENKFIHSCILKMNLVNKILGISFNKNMVKLKPDLRDIGDINLRIEKTNFEIGSFGFFGVEIKQRRYMNINYISLEISDCKISLG